MYMKERKK